MAQTVSVSFNLDEDIKERMEKVCADMGMSISTAFTIFATKVSRESRIPFEVSADPFYSEKNLAYLDKIAEGIDNGTIKLVRHDLIEVD